MLRSALAIILVLAGCAQPPASPEPSASVRPRPTPVEASASPSVTASPSPTTPSPSPEPEATLVAAGDIAACTEEGDSATAVLVEDLEGTVALLGDVVYPAGSDETYLECYDPVWGGWLDRTRPAIGNHDLAADGGAAYFRYFGERAGRPGKGWYSYELGAWHVVVLNSNCAIVDCGTDGPQLTWLAADLAASDADCTLAYWHHARFTSGMHGNDPRLDPIWQALYEADAELVLNGHDHLYERFAPQDPSGSADPEQGLRQLTVGTGGKALHVAVRVAPNSEVLMDDTFGVLVLTLHPDAYDWSFLTVDGEEADAGSSPCH